MSLPSDLVKYPGRVATQTVANTTFFDIFVNVGDEVTSL